MSGEAMDAPIGRLVGPDPWTSDSPAVKWG